MEKNIFYPVLEGKIAEKGITKKSIAELLNISPKAFSNKVTGKVEFTWREVVTMQGAYFSDVSKDELMSRRASGESA